jgi:hypothetical protein
MLTDEGLHRHADAATGLWHLRFGSAPTSGIRTFLQFDEAHRLSRSSLNPGLVTDASGSDRGHFSVRLGAEAECSSFVRREIALGQGLSAIMELYLRRMAAARRWMKGYLA